MAVLILKNISTEGPGTIENFLKKKDIPYRIVEIGEGEIAPPLDRFNALVVLGGPMGVYEMERYPHLLTGSRIIREAINRDMKLLGICLGSQMIAYCLGAEVYPGPEKEIGWHHVELTGDGLKDPLDETACHSSRCGRFLEKVQGISLAWRHVRSPSRCGSAGKLPAIQTPGIQVRQACVWFSVSHGGFEEYDSRLVQGYSLTSTS